MKQFLVFLFSVVIAAHGLGKNFLDKQTFMTLKEAEKRYGTEAFSAPRFKNATAPERARMAASVIKTKQYIGATPKKVIADLGEPTGYFWSRQIPAYLIDEGWADNKDTWQLIFLLGNDGTVRSVKIQKNCCSDKAPRGAASQKN